MRWSQEQTITFLAAPRCPPWRSACLANSPTMSSSCSSSPAQRKLARVGALALARQQRAAWDIASTDILVLDSLSGGDLRLFQEGELLTQPIPSRLRQAAQRIVESDERFAEVLPFALPAGATDAWPFLVYGYAALGVGCIDAATGTPRHYHLPDDSPENLDYDQLLISIDFAELMIRTLADMPAATNRVRSHAP